jgi:hypothetical protein
VTTPSSTPTRRSGTRCAASATPGRTAASQTRRGGARRACFAARRSSSRSTPSSTFRTRTRYRVSPPGDPGVAAKAIHLAEGRRGEPRPSAQADAQAQQVVLGGGLPDGGHVGELTSSRIYTSDYQTLPSDGSSALVLTPAGTAG